MTLIQGDRPSSVADTGLGYGGGKRYPMGYPRRRVSTNPEELEMIDIVAIDTPTLGDRSYLVTDRRAVTRKASMPNT